MCGIIGVSQGNREDDISRGLSLLSHRGPDDSGIFSNKEVTLAHSRLSIIDLSPLGHQPMTVSDAAAISFNGEIYNYKELKKELIEKGVNFKGGSDTEVILQGYVLEGRSFLSKLRGMWALSIYDEKENKIILSRDHFGIKPLYYVIQSQKIHFASELKALKKIVNSLTPNTDKYYEFYNLGYFIGENTSYKEVKKVLPGEIITWDLEVKSKSSEFLSLPHIQKREGITFNDSLSIVEEVIKGSIEKHYIADVEVSLLLSGGADSSLIASLSRQIGKAPVCYHVVVPGSIDTKYAREIAKYLGLNLIEKSLTQASLEEEYHKIGQFLDQPSSDVSIIPTALVYKSIGKGSKVVLSGEGGDELFGGYLRHRELSVFDNISDGNNILDSLYSSSNLGLNFINPILRRIQEKFSSDVIDIYLKNTKTLGFPFENKKIKKILLDLYNTHPYKKFTPVNLFFDQFMYLPDSLMYKNDITSMASSIEARVPLVDREVLRTVASIPDKFRLSSDYQNKIILKTILKKYLPENLVDRPKKGFGFSLEQFDSDFFMQDYKKAAKFHIEHAKEFAINDDLRILLSESKSEIICKKFPRFAFSLITNYIVMRAL